jgi:ABC-2 type transport system permease protein
MRAWRAIFRHEWRCVSATPLAATFIIIYLLAVGLFTFFIGDFFQRGRADLESFFQFQPWLLVVLAPALAMRSWSDAFQNGSAESLLTLPASTFDVVLGKFLCQWCVAAIAIAGTMTLWITASWLGAPDHGVIIASYFASVLIAGVFLALANAISAYCSNSVSSFAISLFAGVLLLALGGPLMQQFFSHIVPKSIALAMQNFGLLASSRMMFRGLVRLPDCLNMALLIGAFLLITRVLVDRRRYVVSRRHAILSTLAVLLAATTASSFLLRPLRLDLTQGQRFTLSHASRALVQNLREPVRLHLMISGTGTRTYPMLQNYAQQVEDLLTSYARASNGKINIQTSIVEANSDSEDAAAAAGLKPIESPTGDLLYFGLIATNSTNGVARLPFLAENADSRLEYDISRAIARAAQSSPSKIAILSALPLATGRGGAFAALQGQSQPMQILNLLQADYDIRLLTAEALNLQDVGVLLLLQPPALSPAAFAAIDTYVRDGGRILVMADPWPERWQDQPGSLTSSQNLAPLLGRWGITLQADAVAVDRNLAQFIRTTTASRTEQLLPYPMWLKLGSVTMFSSGVWKIAPGSSLNVVPLLRGSAQASRISLAEAMANPAPETLSALPLGNEQPTFAFRAQGAQLHGSFIADVDMLDDELWDAQNGNADFLLNEVEYLVGRSNLSGLRSRPSAVRPFTRLQAWQSAAQAKASAKSAALMTDLLATTAQLAALEQSNVDLANRSADIAAFRRRALELRRALRATDKTLRQRGQFIEQSLTAANLIALPALIGLLTVAAQMRRRRRMSKTL